LVLFEYYLSKTPYTNEVNVRAGGGAKETPNFMVDKADYFFGMSGNTEKNEHHSSFVNLISEVCSNSSDEGVIAVISFLKKWNALDSIGLKNWKEISGNKGKWVAFKLFGDSQFIHERVEVRKLWTNHLLKKEYKKGFSLIDGKIHDLQTQYAQFKFGSGASLVSFNDVSYESYGKKKGENALISVEAEFKSSTALKYLFRSKTQRLQIAETTTVFWAEKKSSVENFMGILLNPSIEDKIANIPIQKFLETIRDGKLPDDIEKEKELKFFILGFSLNKARLSLRFSYVSTVNKMMKRLREHFLCLQMERSKKDDVICPGIWHLLKETVREPKDISPVLGGALLRSILTGVNYPQHLFQGVLGRIRVDKVNYLRASILKAVLQRNYKMEVPMSLDTERREIEYLLGRLFAVLEKAQFDAIGNVNASIKDRYYTAASTTPASVFPRLISLSHHHIGKSDYGDISDRRIREIIEHIDTFPALLNLKQQGLFAIAYYQQKNAFYK